MGHLKKVIQTREERKVRNFIRHILVRFCSHISLAEIVYNAEVFLWINRGKTTPINKAREKALIIVQRTTEKMIAKGELLVYRELEEEPRLTWFYLAPDTFLTKIRDELIRAGCYNK